MFNTLIVLQKKKLVFEIFDFVSSIIKVVKKLLSC